MPNIPIAPVVPTEEIEPTRFDKWKPMAGLKPVQFKQQTAKDILSHTDKDESSARSTVAAYLNNRYKANIDDVLLNYDVMSKQFGLSGSPMADAESIRAGEHDIDNRMTSMSLNLEATKQYKQDTSSTWSDIKNSLDVGFLSDLIGAGVQGAAKGFEMMKDPYAGITDAPEGTPEAVTFTSDEDTGRIDFVDKSKIPVDEPLVSSEGVRQWRKEVEERNAISPEFAESFGGQVARAFGQAGALPIYMVAAPIATGMSVAQAYQFGEDRYREYTEQNDVPYDEAEARKAGLWNMPSAALDVIGDKFVVGKILGKARKSGKPMTGSKLREFGRDLTQSGTLGGATEGSQEMWENFNAKYLSGYDPEAKITEGAWTAFKIGTIMDTTSTAVGKGGKSAVEKALDKWFHPIKGMSPQDMGAAFSTVSDPEFEAWNKKAFGNRKDENGVPLQDLARAARQKDMAAAAALSKSQTEQIAEDDADGVTEAERKAADELDERELEPEEYADPFEETSPENEAIQSKRDAIETAKEFIQENPDLPIVQSGGIDKIIARFEAEIAEIEAQLAAEAEVKSDVDPNARPEDVQAAQAADEASREKAGQVSDMVDYLNQTLMEGSELENAPNEIRTLQSDLDSMLRAGVPEAAVKKFAESALKAAGISIGSDPRRITIDGVQQSKVKRDGKYTSKSKIYGTANPFTAIEEIAHDYTDRKVAEGVYTYAEHYRPWVDLIDGKGTSENMSDRDIKERLADYVKGYSLTKAKDPHAAMPTSFRTWLNGALSSIKSVLQSASVLRSLRNVGAINKELEAFLDRSLGLDDAELMRYEQGRQQREVAPDPKDELLQVMKRNKLSVPRPDSDPSHRGELETYFEGIGKKWKYLKKGGSLDSLREGLQAAGFNVDTPSDVLDLLDRSARGEAIYANTDSRSAAQQTADETFSLAGADVTPDANAQSFTSKDGGVVGPASFSLSAFHGTPHKVDKFSTEKIGTGEGLQAYGYGLYFAQDKSVAISYQRGLSANKSTIDGKDVPSDWQNIDGLGMLSGAALRAANGDKDKALESLRSKMARADRRAELGGRDGASDIIDEAIRELENFDESRLAVPQGSLYGVELNIEQDEFLDWDKPLSEQSDKVKSAINKNARMKGQLQDLLQSKPFKGKAKKVKELELQIRSGLDFPVNKINRASTGGSIYGIIIGSHALSPQEASEALYAAGIKGIRYLDGSSRAAGEGNSNYVVFNDSDITVTHENGEAVALPKPEPSFSLSEIDAEAEAQAEAEKARKEGEYKTPTEQKYEAAKADFDSNPESQSDKKFEALILLKEKARKSREAYDLRKSYTDKKKAPAMRKVDKILTERKTFEDVRVTLRKLDEIVRGLHPNLRTRFRGFESPAGYNVNESDRIKFLERQRQRVQDVFDREKYYSERRAARKRWQSWNKNIDEARAGRKKLNVSNGEAVSAFIKDHLPITPEQREAIEDRIDAINDDIFQTLNSTTAGDEKAVTAARAKVAESQTELEGLQQRLGRAKFWSNKVGASQIEMFERDLQSLIKTGRTEFDIRKEKQQEQIKSEASAIKDEIQAAMKSGKKLDQALADALGKRASEDFNTIKTKGRKMAKVEEFITAHLRPETQMDLMTGEADNALIEFIFNRLADAEYAYQAAMQANSDIIKDEVVGDASFDPDAILLAGTSLTVDRAMAIYAYSQSAAGRAHLNSTTFEGMLLTDDVVDQILTSLPAEVKAVVDRSMVFLDTTIYPKINQTFLGQFGVELPRSNNYFPIQGLNRDTSIEDILNDYGHARAVGRGMTKGRVKSELPFENLNFTETFFNAVSRGERYANMSDAHAQARSTMEYKDVTRAENGDIESVNWEMQKAMKARSGVMTESLNGWLARVALGRAAPSDMGWLSVIGSIRRNISAGWLAYNPKTVITQTLSVSPAVGMATDKGEMVSYLTKYGSSIEEATEAAEFANRSSQMMATRGENISLALAELMETQAVKRAFALEGKLSSFRETGFVPMQKFDKYLSVGIWNAEYKTVSNRALSEGKSPDEAHTAGVAAGDKIVRTTQSTADVINSAEIMMSSNQLVRAFVMFSTDINQTMNNMISDFKLSKTDREKFDSALKSAAWMVFLPAVMLSAIAAVAEETAEFLGFKDDDDRKGDDLSNFAKSIASESVSQTVGNLFLVGDLLKGGADMIVGSENSRFANDLNSPVLSVVGNLNTGDPERSNPHS